MIVRMMHVVAIDRRYSNIHRNCSISIDHEIAIDIYHWYYRDIDRLIMHLHVFNVYMYTS
jgi:hypothetical protein